MKYRIEIIPRTLFFKRPAGTSRGVYTERKVWYVRLTSPDEPGRVGIGECAPLPDLSCDDRPDYEQLLSDICRQTEERGERLSEEELENYPSIAFGLETAFKHFDAGMPGFGDSAFTRGEKGIPINGLIWMGDREFMFRQITEKIEAGFRCIKLKIGSIDFEEELGLLRYIRSRFSAREIELRVDANGAFAPSDAPEKLKRLSELELHSIEQPIRAGQWEEMAKLISETPLPIALDEELIGCNSCAKQVELLQTLSPQYIIIKPSLHGNRDRWIRLAEEAGIGWWATSALESNIGLNAIAQWVSTYDNPLPQGLGTGHLFVENVAMPLALRGDELWFYPHRQRTPVI